MRLFYIVLLSMILAVALSIAYWWEDIGFVRTADYSVRPEVQRLIDRIRADDKSETRKAVQSLHAMGDACTRDLVAVLYNLLDQEKERMARFDQARMAESERERLSAALRNIRWRKMQVVVLLGHRRGPEIAETLMMAARRTHPESVEQASILTSLASQGPSPHIRAFCLSLVNSTDSGFYQKRSALNYLAMHARPADEATVDKLLKQSTSSRLYGEILRWAARMKSHDEMLALIENYLAQPDLSREARRPALFILAEVATPAEFQAMLAGRNGMNSWDMESAARICRFHHSAEAEKADHIRELMASYYSEENIAALKYMLENDRTDLLLRHVIGIIPATSGNILRVSPEHERFISLLGFEVSLVSGQLVVEKI